MFPHRFIGASNGGRPRYFVRAGGKRRKNAHRRKVVREDGRLSEEDRAKGIILIAPDFLSSPLCDPGARFLVYPSSLPSISHRLIFPRAGSSKSFLRLIFPSNLHAAVIKGLGRGTSSGASTDVGARGLVLVFAVRTPSKQWRVSWVPGLRSEAGLKFQRIRRVRYYRLFSPRRYHATI